MNIKTADLVTATNKYKNFALFALLVAGVFLFVGFFTQLVTNGLTVNAQSNTFDELTQERTQVEVELKEAISLSIEAQKKLDEANKKTEELREKRKVIEQKINAHINPSYEPKIDEVK